MKRMVKGEGGRRVLIEKRDRECLVCLNRKAMATYRSITIIHSFKFLISLSQVSNFFNLQNILNPPITS